LLRKSNIPYHDCLTQEDFVEKLKLLPRPQTMIYNYFDPDYGVKRLKSTFYYSLRYSKRRTISKSELVEMQWTMYMKHDPKNGLFPEFHENGNFLMQYGANLMKWQIVRGGTAMQVEQYPILTVRRSSNWGWEIENEYCMMRTIDTRRRVNILTPQTPKYRLDLANQVKEEANLLFKDGEYENAILLYKTCAGYVKQVPQDLAKELLVHRNVVNPLATELVALKVAICLNVSTCMFKMGEYTESLSAAQRAIRFDPNSLKGLVRRAQAFFALKNWARCKLDLDVVRKKIQGDPTVEDLYKKCMIEIKREEKYFESVAKAE
jgi:tetratricopeptide (TPR) repeat protein